MDADKQDLCVKLRIESKMSCYEIAKAVGVSRSSVLRLLRKRSIQTLTREELNQKMRGKCYCAPKKSPIHTQAESRLHQMSRNIVLSRHDKMKVSETACLLRLCLNGFVVYSSPFDNDKADWIVQNPVTKKSAMIQVRWASVPKDGMYGSPYIKLTCNEHGETVRLKECDFDFIVAYLLYNDTAYVFSFAEVAKNKTAVSVRDSHAEDWDKIKSFLS